jgi:hypothetical protein
MPSINRTSSNAPAASHSVKKVCQSECDNSANSLSNLPNDCSQGANNNFITVKDDSHVACESPIKSDAGD